MNILMFEVPSAEKEGSVPFGVLYAASSAYRAGHNVKIIDLVKDDLDPQGVISAIKDFRPDIIGMGGITSSYSNCKKLITSIAKSAPGIPIVVGGVITSVSELLLKKAGADVIVHGEGENTFPLLIKTISEKGDLSGVRGISFLRDGEVYKTGPETQIESLDTVPPPLFTLLNMDRYLEPVKGWIDSYFYHDKAEKNRIEGLLAGKNNFFPIITARGCTHRCIFCYRHQNGWRQHSVGYVVGMMRHLRDEYGVGLFQIADELTTGNRRWMLDFCRTLIAEKLGIFYIVLSSRVDTVDEEILEQLKNSGCVMINYGYESGSDLILKEIKKGVTRREALQAGLLTKKARLKNVPEIMIGFPSETEETVADTIDFLKQLDEWPISINTPIPFPATPLWDIAIEKGIITDEEGFVEGYARRKFVNFTKYSDKKLSLLVNRVSSNVKLNWLKNRKRYAEYAGFFLSNSLVVAAKSLIPEKHLKTVRDIWNKGRKK